MSASTVSSSVAAKPQRMTFAQQRLWFVEQLQSPASVPHACVALRMIGALDAERMSQHLAQAVARHEIFLTRFVLDASDTPQAQVMSDMAFNVRREDLSQHRKQLDKRLQQEQQAHVDLTHAPLLRALLVRLSDTEHVLMLSAHAIIIDAPSLVRFTNAWLNAWSAALDGKEVPVVTASASYGDYAAWQQQEWHSGVWSEALREVCENLHGVPPMLLLPWDHPRPPMQTHAVQEITLPVPRQLLTQLTTLCERQSIRLDSGLLGLYAVLLARLSAQTDLCIGVPVDTRATPTLESLPGAFENLLPVRVLTGGDQTVQSLLKDVQVRLDFALARKALPYEKVVEALALPRSLDHAPLLQVAFSTQPLMVQPPVCRSLRFERCALPADVSPFDVALHVALGEKPTFTWQFNAALLERRTLEHWHQYFLTLISSALASTDITVRKIALLDEVQQQALLRNLTGDPAQLAHKQSLYGRIQLLARQVPRHTAIIQGEQFVRYQSLVQQVEMWAASLRSLGISAGERVVLVMPSCAEALVALLAVWRAGGCIVPLSPAEGEDRARALLQHCQPTLVLYHAGTPVSENLQIWKNASNGVCEFYALGGLPPVTNLRDDSLPRHDALAALYYTQENTQESLSPFHGKKDSYDKKAGFSAVQITHGALLNFFQSIAMQLQLRANAQWLARTDLQIDLGLFELLMPLLSGAGLVIATDSELQDPALFAALIKTRSITHLLASPDTFRRLLDAHAIVHGFCALNRNGGFTQELTRDLAVAGATVVNLSGMPETSLVFALQDITDVETTGITVGKPLLNCRLRVVDDQLVQVLPGAVGELLVGGAAISPGYWRRDDLNNERFLQVEGARYFRSGRRARIDSEGRVFMLAPTAVMAEEGSGAQPSAALEQAVLRCWQQLLGRTDIGVEQPLSDVGGNSLVALRLAAHINRYFGASLPLAALLQTPTVRAQAWCLQRAGVPAAPLTLIGLQDGSTGNIPWIFVHAEEGVIEEYRDILPQVPDSVPVYALQCNRYSEAPDIQTLADECAAFLPQQTVVLAGIAFGGVLAAAIAQRMSARVQQLVVLDSLPQLTVAGASAGEATFGVAPETADNDKTTDGVTENRGDEHALLLSRHHRQLWQRGWRGVLEMPVQLFTASAGLTPTGCESGWELLAGTLDVIPLEADPQQLLAVWSRRAAFLIPDPALQPVSPVTVAEGELA